MQFFVGLKEFTPHPVFDPSLFVELRKRVGADLFDVLNAALIGVVSKDKNENPSNDTDHTQDPPAPNKGKLQMDATVLINISPIQPTVRF